MPAVVASVQRNNTQTEGDKSNGREVYDKRGDKAQDYRLRVQDVLLSRGGRLDTAVTPTPQYGSVTMNDPVGTYRLLLPDLTQRLHN
jgi:hypothetical protein